MGIGGTAAFTSLNAMIVECMPVSRGAASSIYNSFRFLGYGLSPVATLPVYLVYGLEGIVLLGSAERRKTKCVPKSCGSKNLYVCTTN